MNKNRKHIAKLVLLVFLLSMVLPTAAFADTDNVSDISGHWAQSTIANWLDQGLIGGYQDGTFKPDQAITRAEFVSLLNKAIGAKSAGFVDFTDVADTDWFYGELQLAMGSGYVAGFEDGSFHPNDTVTRAQAAAFIAKAKGLTSNELAAESFMDSYTIADWAKGAIGAVVNAGYMSGYQDATFGAGRALTRAEAVATLDRVLNGAASKGDDVTIDKAGTTLSSQSVTGNVIITAAVGNGDVTLSGVTVNGDVIVRGGGSNSIHIKDSTVKGAITVEKSAVRVVLEGNSDINVINLNNAATIDSKSFTGSVDTINVNKADKIVTIKADADTLNINADASVKLQSDIVKVNVSQYAEDATLDLSGQSSIATVEANAKLSITGSGKITTLNANASGITVSSNITTGSIHTASGVTEPKKVVSTGGGGGGSSSGGSSSGGSSKPTINGDGYTYNPNTKALTVTGAAGVIIDSSKLNNDKEIQTLTVNASVGEGDVALNGITITGATTIAGGGANSIHFANCNLKGAVSVNKSGVHIKLEGATTLSQPMTIEKPASLSVATTATMGSNVIVKDDLTIQDGKVPAIEVVAEATIDGAGTAGTIVAKTTESVIVKAPTDTVKIETNGAADVKIAADVTNVTISETATNTKVEVTGGATVNKVESNADVTITTQPGSGVGEVTGDGNVTGMPTIAVSGTPAEGNEAIVVTGSNFKTDNLQ